MDCYDWAPNSKNYIFRKKKYKPITVRLECYDWPPEQEYTKHKKNLDLYQTCACAWALDKEIISQEIPLSWDNFVGHCF